MESIVILYGGISPERDVSLISGAEVGRVLAEKDHRISYLDPGEYPDLAVLVQAIREQNPSIVFNALHGGSGENGQLAAALELAGVPFTGSGSKASVLAMDKYIAKLVVGAEGIPLAKHILLRANLLEDYNDPRDYSTFTESLGLPLIVKPNDAGSSVGISIVHELGELKPAVEESFKYCSSVLLEEYIEGRELTVSILDGKALPVVEIRPHAGWYDYHNKYTKGKTEYLAPAPIDEATTQLTQLYAERAFFALGCTAYGRVDFRLRDNTPYFLEVNTLPGMTSLSLTPMAAKAAGYSFLELLQQIIILSRKPNVEET
jgi:D-alanine-D-alanine ligase